MKNFTFTENASVADKARHPDGRCAAQVWCAVRAPSRKAAIEAVGHGWTAYQAKGWWNDTVNMETMAVLDQYPPLTVLIRPLDPHDTVRGQSGWIVR